MLYKKNIQMSKIKNVKESEDEIYFGLTPKDANWFG
jgi:hypothetical protein